MSTPKIYCHVCKDIFLENSCQCGITHRNLQNGLVIDDENQVTRQELYCQDCHFYWQEVWQNGRKPNMFKCPYHTIISSPGNKSGK